MTERPTTEGVYTMTEGVHTTTVGGAADRGGRYSRQAFAGLTTATIKLAAVAYTQTDTVIDSATVAMAAVTTVDVGTQSVKPATVRTIAVGVTAKPRTYDACVTAKPSLKHVGCSADLQTDVRKPAMGSPVTRTTQTDVSPMPVSHTRGTQTTAVPATAVYRRPNTVTQTEVVSAAVQKNEIDDGAGGRPVAAAVARRSNSFHHYTAVTGPAKELPATPQPVTSKIPRLLPATPELNRKVLLRQDTYTKTAAEICSEQPPPSEDNEEDVK